MKRRTFITLSLFGLAGLSAAGFTYLKFFHTEQSNLIKELSLYFNKDFSAAANKENPSFMLSQLLEKNVITLNGSVNKSVLKAIAKDEEQVAVNDWLYSQSEYYLYSLAYIAKTKGVIPLDNFDLLGGDLTQATTKDMAACVSLCDETNKCNAVTYGKMSHPDKNKRQRCFLKSSGVRHRPKPHYESAVK